MLRFPERRTPWLTARRLFFNTLLERTGLMKTRRTALFVFNGDPMCFIHVLLNALDMHARGEEVRIIVEGAATRILPDIEQKEHPLHPLWEKVKSAGLVAGACRACCAKMQTLESARAQHLTLLEDMSGHPGMSGYRDQGFDIITF